MLKKLCVANDYTDIDIGESNYLRKYKYLNLSNELSSEIPIIAVQKSTIEILDAILEELGIKGQSSLKLKEVMGRSGFTKVISKKLGTIGIVGTKGSDSTLSFSGISDYYLGGSDIGDKVISRGVELQELSRIPGEKLWKYKTELLFIFGLNSLNSVLKNGGNLSDFEADILATKFTPTLTKKAIDELPEYIKVNRSELVEMGIEDLNKVV